MPTAHDVSAQQGGQDRGPGNALSGVPDSRESAATVLGSYREMPGLSLHISQAARLFGLHRPTCEKVLEDLVRAGELRRRPDGQYARGQ